MANSFAWLFLKRLVTDSGKQVLVKSIVAALVLVAIQAWILLWFVPILALASLVLYGVLVLLSWKTVGRIVTKKDERRSLSAQQRVNLAFSHWSLPARKSKY